MVVCQEIKLQRRRVMNLFIGEEGYEREYLAYSPDKNLVVEYKNLYNVAIGSWWERRRSGLGMTDKKSFGRIEEIVYGGLAGLSDALRMEYGYDLHIAIIRDIRRIFISQVAFCFNRLNKTDALRLADGIVKDLYRQFSQKSLAFNGGELYAIEKNFLSFFIRGRAVKKSMRTPKDGAREVRICNNTLPKSRRYLYGTAVFCIFLKNSFPLPSCGHSLYNKMRIWNFIKVENYSLIHFFI